MIITVPHETLRAKATPVTQVDKKLKQLLVNLEADLRAKKDPPGVGLAAPQINQRKRVFATFLSPSEDTPQELRLFINPVLVDHSDKVVFGPRKNEERLEGCLSIPGLYGPVPRWEWTEFEFSVLVGDELETRHERFADFDARVMQHEFDHLNGILFTDYSLEYDLPVYRENPDTQKLEEIDPAILETF